MAQFRDVLSTLARLKTESVLREYAIGGAVAVSLWTEPVATQDLDVIVTSAGESHLGEQVVIAGVPVQFLPAWSPLVEEAVATAAEVPYDPADPNSPMVRLIAPTYLVAMWQVDRGADSPRRRERAVRLQEAGLVDEALLAALLSKEPR